MRNPNTTYTDANVGVTYDEGLRTFFAGIYKYMFLAMIWTGIVAAYVAGNPALVAKVAQFNMLFVGLLLVMSLASGFVVSKLTKAGGLAYFFAFATVIGVITSFYLYRYTGESVARAFFMTSAIFGALSFYGYTTKKDISSWGKVLFIGIIVAIAGSFINYFFFQSSALMMAISAAVILISAGMVAYTNQELKHMYYHVAGSKMMGTLQVMGAINLYTSFINIFWSLMNIMGQER